MAVAVHAVNRACFKNGASGVISGMGPIGLLTLQAFKASGGGKTVCIDLSDERLDMAKKYGADLVINAGREKIPDSIGDVVFETSGSNSGAKNITGMASVGGICVQVGWPAGNYVNMNIAQFMDKELTYHGVNRYANAFEAAIEWLSDKRINTNGFVTHVFKFSESAKAFELASGNPGETIKVMIVE
jgi:L-iditol 2-dehydrogenase